MQLNAVDEGPLRNVRLFERHVAGTEANTLAGLQRLGFQTGLISRVGNDELGLAVLMELNAIGVDTSHVRVDPEAPTAVYLVQRGYPQPRKARVFYYRTGSAASRMGPEDVDLTLVASSQMVHLTGITPALSPSCYDAALLLAETASARGIKVSFDTNIRVQLWKTADGALRGLEPFLALSDILFTGSGDLEFLFGPGDLSEQVERIRAFGHKAEVIVVKQGDKGATAFLVTGEQVSAPGFAVPVVDELGAGDAFDAAFLASILKGFEIERAIMYANAAGAITVMVKGDLEPLPQWTDLETFIAGYCSKRNILLR